MQKGFVFTLEAVLSLLIAISLIASLQFLRLPTYSDVYLYQLTNDFQQLAAKKYYPEFAAFSRGDPFSKEKIKSEFSQIINQLGNYCLKIEANSNSLDINCNSESVYKKNFSTNRLFFDGIDFFELKISLLV
jgi:hypothetical protein